MGMDAVYDRGLEADMRGVGLGVEGEVSGEEEEPIWERDEVEVAAGRVVQAGRGAGVERGAGAGLADEVGLESGLAPVQTDSHRLRRSVSSAA